MGLLLKSGFAPSPPEPTRRQPHADTDSELPVDPAFFKVVLVQYFTLNSFTKSYDHFNAIAGILIYTKYL